MREYVLTLLAAAAVTYLLTPLVRRFAIAVGAMHAARDRDVHMVPTPLLGGFAMYAGLGAGLIVASQLPTLNSVFAETNMAKGLLLAGGLLVVMGFVDDRWGMGVISKLAGQVAAGVILVWSGAEVTWLPAPNSGTLGLTSDQQIALTILVVVVTINAVNFIDGLDGLAAGIVGIGAVAFFAYYYTLTHRLGLPEQTGPALASAILAGICLGFLPHNYHPARIFMGDTGAMLIGLLLAYVPISSLANLDPVSLTTRAARHAGTVNRFGEILPLLLPAAILLIPYTDLLMAVFRRTRAGMSPFAPDRKHLHHRMLDIGHSHRSSVLIMYLWAALFAGSVVWLSIVRTPLFVLASVTVGGILALLLVSMPRFRPWARPSAGMPAARAPSAGPPSAGAPSPEAPVVGQAPSPSHGAPAGSRGTPAAGSRRAPAGARAAPAAGSRAAQTGSRAAPATGSRAAQTGSRGVPAAGSHAAPAADSQAAPSTAPASAPPDPGSPRPGPVHHRPARPAARAATSRPRPSSRQATPPTPQAAFHPAPPRDEPPWADPEWGRPDAATPFPGPTSPFSPQRPNGRPEASPQWPDGLPEPSPPRPNGSPPSSLRPESSPPRQNGPAGQPAAPWPPEASTSPPAPPGPPPPSA
jgi:UDP-GlcNAc:undecaprenyl-phosphate/decaprenyl-phosphate GlcNAc-1-phosphate transferase